MAIETLLGGWDRTEQYEINKIAVMVSNGEALPKGLSKLEGEIKKFQEYEEQMDVLRRHNRNGYIFAVFPSLIKADITDEEKKAGLEFCGNKGIHIGGIGYMDPARIISYYCSKCEKEYTGAPKIEIFIDVLPPTLKGAIGEVQGTCKACNDTVIYCCPVWEGQNPDPKHIYADYSGKFIKPTSESIEELLAEIRKQADEKGTFDFRLPKRAQKWAGIINYDLGNKIKELEEFSGKRDIELYQENLGKTVEYISSYINNNMSGRIHVFVDEPSNCADPSDLHCMEKIENLLKYLPKIKLPDDPKLKENISFIITKYKENVLEEGLKETESKKAELEKQAADLNARLAALPKI